MNTKLHVVTNRNTVLFVVDVVIIFNRALRQLEFGPLPQRIGFNLRPGNVGFFIKKKLLLCFLSGDSRTAKFYIPTFRNTLFRNVGI